MNINIIKRAYNRFRYMEDFPAYREFLEQVSSYDVWRVSQKEVCNWWEKRQSSKIEFEIYTDNVLVISCKLESSVIDVEGKGLLVPPIKLEKSSELKEENLSFTYSIIDEYSKFAEEVFNHFGYGHFKRSILSEKTDIDAEKLTPVLRSMHLTAEKHWRYEKEDINKLELLIKGAHERKGLPKVRIWTLPHYKGIPYRVAVSVRYDVDKAIMLMPEINEFEAKYGLTSTAYIRPLGYFYGEKEIKDYLKHERTSEIALHGEFVTTAERFKKDEYYAARKEKEVLEQIIGKEVTGVCMHGGELRTNVTSNTKLAIDSAGFRYETLYRNKYYLPLHLPVNKGISKSLSIGQHYADISAPLSKEFNEIMLKSFLRHFSNAYSVGGVFVPVMHPIYFGMRKYFTDPMNIYRLVRFAPNFIRTIIKMRSDQLFVNKD